MRIIAGLLKGRRLERIDTKGIRPTSDKVKEAVFSILCNEINNMVFLDLFAGSGSVGLEAYSRGASRVVFVDSDKKSIEVLVNNIKKLGIKEKLEVLNKDYANAIAEFSTLNITFDLIFIDPPYGMFTPYDIIKKIYESNILSNYGIIILEQSKKEMVYEEICKFKLIKRKTYGNTQLSFYILDEACREE